MNSMTRGLYPVQTFSIRRAVGSARLRGAWEVIDRDGNWIGYRTTYCAAANWIREVEGLIEVTDVPDRDDGEADPANPGSPGDVDADDDPDSEWADDDEWEQWEDWRWWTNNCRDADGRWAWPEDFRRSTEAVERAEDDVRGMLAGHGYGPDFDMMMFSSEWH